MTSMDIRFHMEVPLVAATGDNFNRVRFMVLMDKYPQAAGLPSIAQILESGGATPDLIVANRQWNLRRRFHMLYDKVYTLYSPQAGGVTVGYMKHLFKQLHFKLHRKKVTYFDNSGSANSIDKNMLVCVWVSDSAIPTHPVVTFDMRLKYQDL